MIMNLDMIGPIVRGVRLQWSMDVGLSSGQAIELMEFMEYVRSSNYGVIYTVTPLRLYFAENI
jgi:hypothetical protein